MDNQELADAAYWAPLLESIADIAFLVVIVALAVELSAGRFAKHFNRQLEAARELEISQLNNETARLRAHNASISDALLATAQAGRSNLLTSKSLGTIAELMALSQGIVTRESISESARSFLIVSKVAPFVGKRFDAVVTTTNFEFDNLLLSLRTALKTAGWIEVDRTDAAGVRGEQFNVSGAALVRIEVSKNSGLLDAAEALASALNVEGIASTVNPESKADPINASVIHILIEPKP